MEEPPPDPLLGKEGGKRTWNLVGAFTPCPSPTGEGWKNVAVPNPSGRLHSYDVRVRVRASDDSKWERVKKTPS
jgi:hypothetical protein